MKKLTREQFEEVKEYEFYVDYIESDQLKVQLEFDFDYIDPFKEKGE